MAARMLPVLALLGLLMFCAQAEEEHSEKRELDKKLAQLKEEEKTGVSYTEQYAPPEVVQKAKKEREHQYEVEKQRVIDRYEERQKAAALEKAAKEADEKKKANATPQTEKTTMLAATEATEAAAPSEDHDDAQKKDADAAPAAQKEKTFDSERKDVESERKEQVDTMEALRSFTAHLRNVGSNSTLLQKEADRLAKNAHGKVDFEKVRSQYKDSEKKARDALDALNVAAKAISGLDTSLQKDLTDAEKETATVKTSPTTQLIEATAAAPASADAVTKKLNEQVRSDWDLKRKGAHAAVEGLDKAIKAVKKEHRKLTKEYAKENHRDAKEARHHGRELMKESKHAGAKERHYGDKAERAGMKHGMSERRAEGYEEHTEETAETGMDRAEDLYDRVEDAVDRLEDKREHLLEKRADREEDDFEHNEEKEMDKTRHELHSRMHSLEDQVDTRRGSEARATRIEGKLAKLEKAVTQKENKTDATNLLESGNSSAGAFVAIVGCMAVLAGVVSTVTSNGRRFGANNSNSQALLAETA